MKNIESNNVKDVTTPIHGYPDIRSKYTGDHTRQFQPHFTTSYATTKKKNNQQLSMGNGKGGWGAEWTVTSSTNECMGAIIEENVHSYKQSNQEYENIW